MRTIKMLSQDIECNILEADEKMETAYSLKLEHPAMALWYRDMAQAHLGFNTKGHELVAAEIQNYKNSQHYADHPEYADGMLAVWNDKHADLITRTSRIKSMIDSFK